MDNRAAQVRSQTPVFNAARPASPFRELLPGVRRATVVFAILFAALMAIGTFAGLTGGPYLRGIELIIAWYAGLWLVGVGLPVVGLVLGYRGARSRSGERFRFVGAGGLLGLGAAALLGALSSACFFALVAAFF